MSTETRHGIHIIDQTNYKFCLLFSWVLDWNDVDWYAAVQLNFNWANAQTLHLFAGVNVKYLATKTVNSRVLSNI